MVLHMVFSTFILTILVHNHYAAYFPDGYGYPYRAQDVLECEFILLEAMVSLFVSRSSHAGRVLENQSCLSCSTGTAGAFNH